MITNSEINAIELSPTKKDFYQIWNELLDVASKISERWDPTSTNESDPGIVLLKVLTAVADKLNYNIDANTLEAFMPSAAQESSMKKLCDMLGYNMKYYRSATTTARISYNSKDTEPFKSGTIVAIDRFTNLKTNEGTINYITLEPCYITDTATATFVPCMEGELVECETDNDNIISLLQLDDNNRYFLPETQVAENGIFVTNVVEAQDLGQDNVVTQTEGEFWNYTQNLNTVISKSKVFKFGFDSKENLPYIQFPDDISAIIEDGLKIRYVRTSGVNGNIKPGVLATLESPVSWSAIDQDAEDYEADWYDVKNYTVRNTSAARDGSNKESISDAYTNYKKTIGTFDTLVTCRDYMNKIYQLTYADNPSKNLVSNCIVSDIRDDINRAYSMCTFDMSGVKYKDMAVLKTADANAPRINHFDLVLYPFKPFSSSYSKADYKTSFEYSDTSLPEICAGISQSKTISHQISTAEPDDIVCIRNKYQLTAQLITTKKVNAVEQAAIEANVQQALYKNFNMRTLEFGEEIPYEAILKVIETADPRIKTAILQPPEIKPVFLTENNNEIEVYQTTPSTEGKTLTITTDAYNKLMLNNVLAGRISLFNYNENFETSFAEAPIIDENGVELESEIDLSEVVSIKPELELTINASASTSDASVKLTQGEVIQFRKPNVSTSYTYPAYVNYYAKLPNVVSNDGIPAEMISLSDFFSALDTIRLISKTEAATTSEDFKIEVESSYENVSDLRTELDEKYFSLLGPGDIGEDNITDLRDGTASYFRYDSDSKMFTKIPKDIESLELQEYANSDVGITKVLFNADTFIPWAKTFKLNNSNWDLYRVASISTSNIPGYLIDEDSQKYVLLTTFVTLPNLEDTYINDINAEDGNFGRGRDASPGYLPKNSDYILQPGDYILFSYSKSVSDSSTETTVVSEYLGPGAIIKPNFELSNSKTLNDLGHNYTKTDGFGEKDDFILRAGNSIDSLSAPEGMFTLSVNEQIEVRNRVQVSLDSAYANIYWERNDDAVQAEENNGIITFKFDEQDNSAYTLKEGEYFYYTDSDRLDLAYYGSGTVIKKSTDTPTLRKQFTENAVTAEEISTLGIGASIPWITVNLGSSDAAERQLTIQEYEYINLTAGDALIITKDTLIGTEEEPKGTITATFTPISNIKYRLVDSGSATVLPSPLSSELTWEICSKLELSTGPNLAQKISEKSSSAVYTKTAKVCLIKNNAAGATGQEDDVTLEGGVSIKTNYVLLGTGSSLNAMLMEAKKTAEKSNNKVWLKRFDSTIIDNTATTLDVFGDGHYNAYTLAKEATGAGEQTNSPSFNVLVPQDHIALMSVFYTADTDGEVRIEAKDFNNTPASISALVNLEAEDLTNWEWRDPNGDTLLASQLSIEMDTVNTVVITQSCKLSFSKAVGATGEAVPTIIFSNFRLVPCTTYINPQLGYIEETGNGFELIQQIRKLTGGGKFLYPLYVTNSMAISLTDPDTTTTLDTLANNPSTWYDYNNVNNKFVISMIDPDYLERHVKVAKTSRL